MQAARWRLRSSRQIWLIVSALVIAACAEAIAVPAKRGTLACAVAGLIGMGLRVTGRRRQRREREALAARLAAVSRRSPLRRRATVAHRAGQSARKAGGRWSGRLWRAGYAFVESAERIGIA